MQAVTKARVSSCWLWSCSVEAGPHKIPNMCRSESVLLGSGPLPGFLDFFFSAPTSCRPRISGHLHGVFELLIKSRVLGPVPDQQLSLWGLERAFSSSPWGSQ